MASPVAESSRQLIVDTQQALHGRVNSNWPHGDGLLWPHLLRGIVLVGRWG